MDVWAEWAENDWYHGSVAAHHDNGLLLIHFDDGDQAELRPDQVAFDTPPSPEEVSVGSRVLAPWMFSLYPARVSEDKGNLKYGIQFDDGASNSSKLNKLRLIGK